MNTEIKLILAVLLVSGSGASAFMAEPARMSGPELKTEAFNKSNGTGLKAVFRPTLNTQKVQFSASGCNATRRSREEPRMLINKKSQFWELNHSERCSITVTASGRGQATQGARLIETRDSWAVNSGDYSGVIRINTTTEGPALRKTNILEDVIFEIQKLFSKEFSGKTRGKLVYSIGNHENVTINEISVSNSSCSHEELDVVCKFDERPENLPEVTVDYSFNLTERMR